ncbi:MAG: homocysteine S-methyltransferase family protein [Acidimicrobiia bacterium]
MSVGPAWFDERIATGKPIILDGGTGTGLETRGVPMVPKGWSVMAQLEYPEILHRLHTDYIESGAEVIITNTFGAGRHLLEPGGLGSSVEDAHRLATEIALRARADAGKPVVVAGSISHYMADGTDQYWLDHLSDTYQEQVSLLVESGVDVIVLEMMEHPVLAIPAIDAAKAGGLPVWLGVSSRQTTEGLMTSYGGEDIDMRSSFQTMIERTVDAVFVMHTAVPDVTPTIELVNQYWDGPLGVYPESGYYREPNWQFVDIIGPSDLAAHAQEWVELGARMVGGCCGLDTEHLDALKNSLTASVD